MSERIIFQPVGAPMAILTPCDCGLSVLEIAKKDVPQGVPFWVVSAAEVEQMYQSHGDLRDAWEVTEQSIGRPPLGRGGDK